MRTLGWLVLLLFFSGAIAQQCPPANFGADTYRIGVFTGQGTVKPGLKCDGSTATGRECSGFLASAVDGALLDVSVSVPPGNGPHPLIVLLHGWGGSKGSFGYLAEPLLADGHAVLRYSARGFGESWGQVNLADINVELADLRSMIAQVVDEGRLHLNPDAVGVVGLSYGGGQTWLSLLQPSFSTPHGASVRIRTAVPVVPWTDLVYALMPNGKPENSLAPLGSLKLSLVNALYVSGLREPTTRPYPNYPEYLTAWNGWLNAVEPCTLVVDPVYPQIVAGVAGYRSIWWQEAFWAGVAANRVPIFQVQGMPDDLFPLPEATRMLQRLDPRYPIASYFGDLGHPRAANKGGERDYLVGLIRQWFAYYLQARGTEPEHVVHAAITRPRAQAFNPADVKTAQSLDALANGGTLTKDFGGTARLVNPGTDPLATFTWDPLYMEAARELEPLPPPPDSAIVAGSLAEFSFNVGAQSLIIAGQPIVSLVATPVVPALRVQLNVRLFDLGDDGTKELITRGTFLLDGGVLNKPVPVTIPTFGNFWEVKPNHTLKLEISNVDSPYLRPSTLVSTTDISSVQLALPIYLPVP